MYMYDASYLEHLVSCSLRAIRETEDGWNQLLAGFFAGFAFLFNGSTEIAMYVASKAAESSYYHCVNNGWLPSLPFGEVIAFSLSCGILFNVCLYEPHNLGLSYFKFLNQISDGKYTKITKAFAPIREEYGIPNMHAYKLWNSLIEKMM